MPVKDAPGQYTTSSCAWDQSSSRWLDNLSRVQSHDHRTVLAARANVAYWTGRTGHGSDALALYTALLPDMVRVLGADHPHTIAVRQAAERWKRIVEGEGN